MKLLNLCPDDVTKETEKMLLDLDPDEKDIFWFEPPLLSFPVSLFLPSCDYFHTFCDKEIPNTPIALVIPLIPHQKKKEVNSANTLMYAPPPN